MPKASALEEVRKTVGDVRRAGRAAGRRGGMARIPWLLIGLLLVARPRHAPGGDWPQILGPNRSGVAIDETAPTRLPAATTPAWNAPVGQGYAGPAVVGSTVLLFHRVDNHERLQAFDHVTGQSIWQQDFEANYRGGVDPDTGPRCVPVVSQGRVVVYGAAGVVHVVRLSDGQPLWSRDVVQDFRGNDGYFGAGTSPLIVGERLLLNVGGREGAGLVALELQSGKTLWQATDEAASYASPTLVRHGQDLQVLFVTRLNALLVDPQTGQVTARYPFGRTGPTVNAATPLVFDDYVFLTASYRVGAALLRIKSGGWDSIWANDETLSSQYNTPVYADGHLYGIHGREDVGPAELRCVEAKSGRVLWREPDFGVAHLIRIDNRLLILKVDGTLLLAEVDASRFRELGRINVSNATTRALPAFSDGRLFVRDNSGRGGRLMCFPL